MSAERKRKRDATATVRRRSPSWAWPSKHSVLGGALERCDEQPDPEDDPMVEYKVCNIVGALRRKDPKDRNHRESSDLTEAMFAHYSRT